ncbi:sensory transduction histidine kinase [Candidatus Magnetoovum chiemensis]|nr:sensory transduction histidine kinase [Candidatus Magnetoovum chiemensis]
MNYFQRLLTNFCNSVGIAAALIDLKGNILAAARWQRACTDFHRVNEDTCALCIESDTELALNLKEGKKFSIYRCKNGLTDAASPIVINGRHLANAFVGQFFLHPPDLTVFTEKAKHHGFNIEQYIPAIMDVPVISQERLPDIMGFLVNAAEIIASISMERVRAQKAEEAMTKRAAELLNERATAISLAEDSNQARAQIERYKDQLEHLVEERTQELKKSERQSRLILECAGEGIFGADANGSIVFVNNAALTMLGYSENEIIGQNVHSLIHHTRIDGTPYPKEDSPLFKTYTLGTSSQVSDDILWRKNGYYFSVEYSTTPVKDGETIIGSVVTFRDITIRKEMEEELLERQKYLQYILDTSPVGVVFSTNDVIHFANPRFNEMFGVDVGESSPHIYVNESDREIILERLSKEGKVVEQEILMYDASRSIRNTLITYLPINYFGEDGILGWFQDITNIRKAEEDLRKHIEDLERFTRLTVGRELRMIHLKEEINSLLEKQGFSEKYKIVS